MSFVLLACSDIRGQKVNLELPFDAPPRSMEELRTVLELTFRGEEETIKRVNRYTDTRPCEPFTINRLQRYNDDTQSWTEITSPQMLQTYDQVYIFRKNTSKADIATERELPAPRRSSFFPNANIAAQQQQQQRFPGGSSAEVATQNSPPRPQPSPPRTSDPTAAWQSGAMSYGTYNVPPQSGYATASSSPYRYPSNHAGSESAGAYGQRPSTSAGDAAYIPPLPLPSSTSVGAAPSAVGAGDGSLLVYRERTTPERVEYLFRFADQTRRGGLGAGDYEVIFRASDIRFPSSVVYDLFQHFSRTAASAAGAAGGIMSPEDFQRYASDFPVAVNIAYQRITNQEREEALLGAQREAAKRLDDAQRQVKDLQERLAAAQRELQTQSDQKTFLQTSLQELYRQREPEYCRDEQQLLDKEVSVFKYRERLSREEQDYERMAMERRRRSVQQSGSVYPDREGYSNGPARDSRYGPA